MRFPQLRGSTRDQVLKEKKVVPLPMMFVGSYLAFAARSDAAFVVPYICFADVVARQ